MIESPSRWKNEIKDIGLFFTCFCIIVLTWVVFFSWAPGKILSYLDGLSIDFVYILEIIKASGNWKHLIYRQDWLGGVKLFEAAGLPGLYALGAKLNCSPVMILNLAIWLSQAIYSYLCIRLIQSIYFIKNQSRLVRSYLLTLALVWIFAFAPVLAWKFSNGHWGMLMGTLFSIGAMSVYLAGVTQTQSLTNSVLFFLVCFECFHTTLQQPIIYGVIFGFPIFIGILYSEPLSKNLSKKSALFVVLIVLAAFGLSLDIFSLLVGHAFNGDGARGLKGSEVTFSYLTGSWNDLFSSITWSRTVIPSDRDGQFWHEVNYPWGPFLALLFLAVSRTQLSMVIGLCVSFVAAWLFSMNVFPISDVFLTLIPFLKSFRVPTRAVLPFTLLLPVCVIPFLISHRESASFTWRELKRQFHFRGVILILSLSLFLLLIFFGVPSGVREVILWGSCGWFVYENRAGKWNRHKAVFLFLILGLGSIFAFKERYFPLIEMNVFNSQGERLREEILQNAPDLKSPFVRAKLDWVSPVYDINIGRFLDFSIPNGYFFPLERYSRLVQALNQMDYQATVIHFDEPLKNIFDILQKIYNVQYVISLDSNRNIKIKNLPLTLGSGWFSSGITFVRSFDELGYLLRLYRNSTEKMGEAALTIQNDLAVMNADLRESVNPICKNSKVKEMREGSTKQDFEIEVDNQADCPLTLSMNYANHMRASTHDFSSQSSPLKVFPSYGALTGIWVPKGVTKIHLRVELDPPAHLVIGGWLLFFICMVGVVYLYFFGAGLSAMLEYKNIRK